MNEVKRLEDEATECYALRKTLINALELAQENTEEFYFYDQVFRLLQLNDIRCVCTVIRDAWKDFCLSGAMLYVFKKRSLRTLLRKHHIFFNEPANKGHLLVWVKPNRYGLSNRYITAHGSTQVMCVCGRIKTYDKVRAYAYEDSYAKAYDNSVMFLKDRAIGTFYNYSRGSADLDATAYCRGRNVIVTGNATCYAYSGEVFAYDLAKVHATENVLVFAYDLAKVYATKNVIVNAYGSAVINRV